MYIYTTKLEKSQDTDLTYFACLVCGSFEAEERIRKFLRLSPDVEPYIYYFKLREPLLRRKVWLAEDGYKELELDFCHKLPEKYVTLDPQQHHKLIHVMAGQPWQVKDS